MNVEDQEITDNCLIHIWMKQQTRKKQTRMPQQLHPPYTNYVAIWTISKQKQIEVKPSKQPTTWNWEKQRSEIDRYEKCIKEERHRWSHRLEFELWFDEWHVRGEISHEGESNTLETMHWFLGGWVSCRFIFHELKYLLYLFILLKFHSLSFLAYFRRETTTHEFRKIEFTPQIKRKGIKMQAPIRGN